MSVKLVDVKEDVYPKSVRKAVNALNEVATRPMEVSFEKGSAGRFEQTNDKLTLVLPPGGSAGSQGEFTFCEDGTLYLYVMPYISRTEIV